MTAPGQPDRERQLAERLKRFLNRADAEAVGNRQMPWRETVAGRLAVANLHSLACFRIQGHLTQRDYEDAVRELAVKNAMPLSDVRMIAEGAYELKRCYYLAAELIPVALGDWYADGELDDGY